MVCLALSRLGKEQSDQSRKSLGLGENASFASLCLCGGFSDPTAKCKCANVREAFHGPPESKTPSGWRRDCLVCFVAIPRRCALASPLFLCASEATALATKVDVFEVLRARARITSHSGAGAGPEKREVIGVGKTDINAISYDIWTGAATFRLRPAGLQQNVNLFLREP
jgi:hypothetical protein